MNNRNFTDKELLGDALNSQKQATGNYNISANECAAKPLKSEIMNILSEEHQIQHDLFTEMQNRGWYNPSTAAAEKIKQAKDKFTSSNPQNKR